MRLSNLLCQPMTGVKANNIYRFNKGETAGDAVEFVDALS